MALALEEIEEQILEAEDRHAARLRAMRRILDKPLNRPGAVRRYVELLLEGRSVEELIEVFGKPASSG